MYPNLKLGQTPPKGYIQVYTGDGKGKTTAILGLALRAIGANKSIFIGQFLKDDKYGVYSEVKAINNYLPSSNIRLEQFGSGDGFVDRI
ncbi:MAG: cob(I)yrinic acid a,c-diamide adenosyltransferase, partial [bacterium]